MLVANSAAQVSTRLYTGRMPSAVPLLAHRLLVGIEQVGQAPVGEALALELAQRVGVDVVERLVVELHLELDDLLDLVEEPGSILREAVDLLEREAVLERVADVPDALGAGLAELLLERLAVARASGSGRRRRPRGRAAPSGTTPGRCGRSPSPRPPTSSAWSGGRWPAGISRRRSAAPW